ncbi:unnamed protein product [Clonostachys rosea]|uniref:Uncharacterized protein n=1 Tax=Bionectria ochroleuca TaxID=29856 RepID=A0ABY6UN91_BIOOC|nr:unnamed protein product [Clonostachys rosea]
MVSITRLPTISIAVLAMAYNAMAASPQFENAAIQARDIWDGSDSYDVGYNKRSFSSRSLEDDEVAVRARDILQARSDLAQLDKRFFQILKGIIKGASKAGKSDSPCYGKGPSCERKEKALKEKKARAKKAKNANKGKKGKRALVM